MKFYKIHPEVPGGIGKNITYNKAEVPWQIEHFHAVFEGWLGGDLLKISACYLVTNILKEKLFSSEVTGIIGFQDFEIELSDTFKHLYPGKELPKLYWMQLNGNVQKDDLAMNDKNKLIVSELAMEILQSVNLSIAEIEVLKS